jgi:CBS domain-containing protein
MVPSHRRVEDVMTTPVVTADRLTPYKEIARLLAEHRISGLPVLADGWQVIGVVSEADLLAARDQAAAPRHLGPTAGDLMTAPPVTVPPDAAISAAVRLMNAHHVRRLPVTGADRQLIGIVSRRDVLSVFLRPDIDIARDVRLVLGEVLAAPAAVTVTVCHGVVTLTGTLGPTSGRSQEPRTCHDLSPLTARLMGDVDGVIDVVTRLSPAAAKPPHPA